MPNLNKFAIHLEWIRRISEMLQEIHCRLVKTVDCESRNDLLSWDHQKANCGHGCSKLFQHAKEKSMNRRNYR